MASQESEVTDQETVRLAIKNDLVFFHREESQDNRLPVDTEAPSTKLAAKVFNSLHHFAGTCVNELSSDNIEEYIEFIDTHYPIDEEDWGEMKAKMKHASQVGPKLNVSCKEGSLPGFTKKEKIQLVVFIKGKTKREIKGTPTDNDDHTFKFDCHGSLSLNGSSNDILRVEVRKIKKADNTQKSIIGFVELQISDITEESNEQIYYLTKSDGDVIYEGDNKRNSNSTSTYLKLALQKDVSEENSNISVPEILKTYFCDKALRIFDISKQIYSSLTFQDSKLHHVVVNQYIGAGFSEKYLPWQKLLSSQDRFIKNTELSNSFPVECILTEKLQVGIDTCPTPRNSVIIPSPRNSLIINEAPGITNTPDSMFGRGNTIRRSIGKKLGENLFPQKSSNKSLTIDLAMLLPKQNLTTHTIEGQPHISWSAEIREESPNSFTEDELQFFIVQAILKSTHSDGILPQNWDGNLNKSVRSVLKILEESSNLGTASIASSKAKAFLVAHSLEPPFESFSNKILHPYIENLAKENESNAKHVLSLYEDYALNFLTQHRELYNDDQFAFVINNLKILMELDEHLLQRIKDCLKKQATKMFTSWKTEAEAGPNIMQDFQETSQTTCNVFPAMCVGPNLVAKDYQDVMSNFDLSTTLLNDYVYPELQKICSPKLDMKWPESEDNVMSCQEAFSKILDYRIFVARVYVEECKKYIDEEASAQYHNIANPEAKLGTEQNPLNDLLMMIDQASFNCFSAFKHVFDLISLDDYSWLYQHFTKYPNIWMRFAIRTAFQQMNNTMSTLGDHSGSQDSLTLREQDAAFRILYALNGISNTVWVFWHQLNWPDLEIMLNSGFILIEGLALLDKKIIDEYHDIHMKDCVYEAHELADTIKVLDALKEKQRSTVDQLENLNQEIAKQWKDGGNEEQNEIYITKIKECYELIEKTSSVIEDEIRSKMELYCSGIKIKMKKYIQEKNLHRDDQSDCLLDFVINIEMKKLQENIGIKKYCQGTLGVNQMLWNTMEEEVYSHFQSKKERNLQSNKPARFQHLTDAINNFIETKETLVNKGLIASEEMTNLLQMKEDLSVLMGTPDELIKKHLLIKAQIQAELQTQASDLPNCQMRLKLELDRDAWTLTVEPMSLQGIPKREGRDNSNIQLEIIAISGQNLKQTKDSPVYSGVEDAIAFDLTEESPKKHLFKVDDKCVGDLFVIVHVFDVQKTCFKQFIGELILKGDDIAGMAALPTPSSWIIGGPQMSNPSPEYLELTRRQDNKSKEFVAKEEKHRSKKKFFSFS